MMDEIYHKLLEVADQIHAQLRLALRAVVIARPTASPVLYEQMIGRGMRGPLFGGTEECLVIDVADNLSFRGQMAYQRYADYWTE